MTKNTLLTLFLLAIATGNIQLINVNALTENQRAEKILAHLKGRAMDLRDEIKTQYEKRCDSDTLNSCYRNNTNTCSSAFPNPQCFKKDEFDISITDCECGCECVTIFIFVVFRCSIQTPSHKKLQTTSQLGYYDIFSHHSKSSSAA